MPLIRENRTPKKIMWMKRPIRRYGFLGDGKKRDSLAPLKSGAAKFREEPPRVPQRRQKDSKGWQGFQKNPQKTKKTDEIPK